MRLTRKLLRSLATTLALVMLLTAFGPMNRADAGLFSKIKDTVKAHPVMAGLGGVAAVGGAIVAAPYIAGALGFGSGVAVAGGAGVGAAIAGAGAGIATIGTTIWGGLVAAGGFVTGALGAVGGAIGGMFSGIAGFIGGIIGSPLFIPALVVIGVAVVGYLLWKKYKRQSNNGIGNSNNIPTISMPTAPEISANPSVEIPVNNNSAPIAANPEVTPAPAPAVVAVNNEVTPAPEVTPTIGAPNALKTAHEDYIKAYNKYISIVTNIGGSENPDEEMRTNMRRSDTQTALNNYREAYNKYISLLQQSNSK